MKNNKFSLCLLVSLWAFYGCASTISMNNVVPFSKYVRKEVTLLRSENIWEIFSKHEYHFTKYRMKSLGSSYFDDYAVLIMQLPVGTKIKVEDVKKISDSSGSMIYAICSMKKEDGEVLRFEYNLGGSGRIHIAPWESLEVGKHRNYE